MQAHRAAGAAAVDDIDGAGFERGGGRGVFAEDRQHHLVGDWLLLRASSSGWPSSGCAGPTTRSAEYVGAGSGRFRLDRVDARRVDHGDELKQVRDLALRRRAIEVQRMVDASTTVQSLTKDMVA